MTFSRFHFIFLYFWITKRRKLAHYKFRFSGKEGAVFWDTLPRGVRISTKNNALEEQGLSFFFKYLRSLRTQNSYKNPGFIVWPICITLRFAIFVATLTFPAKRQRFGLVQWAGSVYISRFGTGPNSIGPWSLHMSKPERYRLHN